MAFCRGLLHNHSENSIRDSAMKIKDLVARAREMGAAAVALTDHGVLSGFFEFMQACAGETDANGVYTVPPIKGIPGVEAYFIPDREKEDINTKRQHLLLLAKDTDGYYAISKAVTESYTIMDNRGFPRMDYTMLEKHFGPGSRGHGHVIATSACMNGILAQVLLSDEDAQRRIDQVRKRQTKYHPIDDEYLDLCREQDERLASVKYLKEERDRLQPFAKANIKTMQRKLAKMEEADGATDESRAFARTIPKSEKEKAKAAARLIELKEELAVANQGLSLCNQRLKDMESQVDKWEAAEKQIEEIRTACRSEAAMYEDAKQAALRFSSIFGEGHFFVEVQYHGIETEARCMSQLVKLARELELHLVACNDAHYMKPEDAHARDIVSALRFNRLITEEKEEGYGQMYLKSDEEQKAALLEILDEDAAEEAMQGISSIVEMCDFQVEHETHYPRFIGGDPDEGTDNRLRRLAEAGIPWRYPTPGEWTEEHRQRMEYELDIINRAGYNDYLCIVQDDLDYGRMLALENEDGVGYGVGPGRGSAVGSLVCYLIGITSVDPVRYGLLFERFLNMERVSQPDIDSDFHTELRGKVLENVQRKHGKGAVAWILTKGTMAAKGSIRNVGRVTGVPVSTVDRIARMIPGGPNVTLANLPDDLQRLYDTDPVIRQLIDDARLVEGTAINFGTHAAGVIISDNDDVSDYVPLMYMTDKERWAIQCDMVEAEAQGLLKMDFLGLNNIDVIDDALHRIYRNMGIRLEIEKIPEDTKVYEQIFAAGKTKSVFQFESPGMREMLRKFRPGRMEDIILLVAAYRPGPMQYLDSIIKVKHGKMKPAYIIPQLESILQETYGKPIFQEQVMMIFNKVAGFSLGEADIIRRAMSKKKLSILTDPKTNYKGKFIEGLVASGASGEQAEKFWEELLEFANYAFNKSHAAAYAKVAYMTAYLKYHYPAEYMCSVMARTTYDKLPMLIAECHSRGLEVNAPDINASGEHFANEGNVISFGFSDIKNVGNAGKGIVEEREKGGPYRSFKDFLIRSLDCGEDRPALDRSAIESLIRSGALDRFGGGNRDALALASEGLIQDIKKRRDKRLEMEQMQEEILDTGLSLKEKKSLERKISNREKAIQELDESIQAATVYTTTPENRREKLEIEKNLLGFYVSGHPLDDYAAEIIKENVTDIAEITEGPVKVCGLISELKIRARKKDGKPLAFFKLVDRTGEMDIKCWTAPYGKYKHLIEEDAVVVIEGKYACTKETDEDGQEIIVDSGITINTMKKLTLPDFTKVMVTIPFLTDWLDSIQKQVKQYEVADGVELIVYDELLDQILDATFRVSPDILSARILGATVVKV